MNEPVFFTSTAALAPAQSDAELAPEAAQAQQATIPATAVGPDTEGVAPNTEGVGLTSEVVLLTRNSCADLARSLPAIRAAAAVANAALLVVDLGSTDGTQDYLARHAPGGRAVWLAESDGLIDALAVAAACSTADVLVVLRPSLEPASPHSVARLVAHLDEHPYAGMAAPALRAHTGAMLSSTRPTPLAGEYSRVEWVLGAAFAVRRGELDAIVRCAARLPRSLHGLRLCLELRRRGREVHYVQSAELIDAGGRVAERAGRGPRRSWRFLVRHPRYTLRLAGRKRAARLGGTMLARALEIAVAGVLLALLSPLLLAIAIAIRLDSGGPALFRQVRLGRGARPFQMYKFRTMRTDVDPTPHAHFVRNMIVNRLRADGGSETQVFKVHPDPRITRFGRLLRRTSLDELPQLFNVLRGDMTLVGFRPPIPYEVAEYPAWYHRRFDGRPGITGLWQVSGRNECSYEDMVRLDIEYLNRRSWLLDLLLLARTVGAVLGGRGAY
jgi:lipopolysaccharide/colanic/teichoic acid biosynthesis glycosyltransferase